MEAAVQLVRGALRRSTAWREPGSSRDLRLDLLRGWCIVLIVLDHASGWAGSPFDRITGANAWLVTGTEGFVIVSGLTAGMVYGRVIVRRGLGGATLRLWRRAGFVYIAAVIGGLPPVLLALAHREGGEAVLDALGTALALRDTGIVAILYLWVALFLLAPLPIALLARGHTGVAVALGVAAIAAQAWRQAGGAVFDGTELAGAETVRPLLLAFGLWTLAAAAGWNRARIAAAWRAGPALTAGACVAGLVAVALVPDVVPAALLSGPDGPGQLDSSTVVRSYAVVLAATALVAVLAWTLVSAFQAQILAVAGRLLVPFGQLALPAVTIHVLLFYVQDHWPPEEQSRLARVGVQVAMVTLTWALVLLFAEARAQVASRLGRQERGPLGVPAPHGGASEL